MSLEQIGVWERMVPEVQGDTVRELRGEMGWKRKQ